MPEKIHFSAKERRQAYYVLHEYANTQRPSSHVLEDNMPSPWERAFSLSVQLWCPPEEWTATSIQLQNRDLAILSAAFRKRDGELHEQFQELVHFPLDERGGYGKNWRKKREEVLENHGRYCERCRLTEAEHFEKYGVSLHIHHKTPLREFDDISEANRLKNLVPLCAECHRTVESD